MIPNPLRILAMGTALAVFAGGALAQNTAVGTVVTNTIGLSYNSGGGSATVSVPAAASVEFNVDRKIDVVVTALAASGQQTAVPGETVTWSYEVENEGNGNQGFTLVNTVSGADGGTVLSLSRVDTSSGTLEEGEYRIWVNTANDLMGATVYGTDEVLAFDREPGESFFVIYEARAEITAQDGQNNVFEVVATVTYAGSSTAAEESRAADLTDLNATNTVFADEQSSGVYDTSVTYDALTGSDGSNARLLITAPDIQATKEVAVLSENLPGQSFNCAAGGTPIQGAAAAIPGACIEYTITLTNNSDATAAEYITITDELQSETTFAGLSEGDFTSVTESGGTVTATLQSLAAGSSASFTIRAFVD